MKIDITQKEMIMIRNGIDRTIFEFKKYKNKFFEEQIVQHEAIIQKLDNAYYDSLVKGVEE